MFLHKACFNSSRLIVDSVSANDDYSTIKKIFHINLLYFSWGKLEQPLYHGQTIFREVATDHRVSMHFSALGGKIIEAHNIMPEYLVICIPLFNDEIQEELDEWLYMLKHAEVREDFQSPYMQQVADRLSVLKLPPKDLAAYRQYRSASLKERDRIVSAKEEGMEKGLKQGEKKGLEKGLKKGMEKGLKKGREERDGKKEYRNSQAYAFPVRPRHSYGSKGYRPSSSSARSAPSSREVGPWGPVAAG